MPQLQISKVPDPQRQNIAETARYNLSILQEKGMVVKGD